MRMRTRLLVAAALLGNVGCVQRGQLFGEAKPPSSLPAAPGGSADELPGKETAGLCMTMAESLDKDGKEADAIAYYERARHLEPSLNDRAARRLAVLYDRQDEQAKALTEFQTLLKKRPKDAGLLNDLGYSYYNRGQWAEAEVQLRKAVAADKTSKRAWVNLGLALAQQGKYQEGLDAFGKVVSPAESQANLAFVLMTQGKKDEAAVAYRKALELEPTLKTARTGLEKIDASGAPAQPPPAGPTGS